MAKQDKEQTKRALLINFIFFFIPLILIFVAFSLEIDPLLATFIYIGLTILIVYYGYRAYRNYITLRKIF